MSVATAFTNSMDAIFKTRLEDQAQRDMVVSAVMTAFDKVQKKPVANLAERIKQVEQRVQQMSEQVELGFVNGRLVVKVAGSSEALMKEFRRGTDWYLPWDEIDEVVLAAILVEPSK